MLHLSENFVATLFTNRSHVAVDKSVQTLVEIFYEFIVCLLRHNFWNCINTITIRLDFCAFMENLKMKKCARCIWYTYAYKISKVKHLLQYLLSETISYPSTISLMIFVKVWIYISMHSVVTRLVYPSWLDR